MITYALDRAKDMRYASYTVLAGAILGMLWLIKVYLASPTMQAKTFWAGVALYVALLVVGAVLHNIAERNAAARDESRGFEVIPHDDDEK